MMQGCIGAIEFSVSPLEVFTWRNMERKRGVRFGEHAVLEGVPRLQRTGRELDTVTLAVVLVVFGTTGVTKGSPYDDK